MSAIILCFWVAFFGYSDASELSDEQLSKIEIEVIVAEETGG